MPTKCANISPFEQRTSGKNWFFLKGHVVKWIVQTRANGSNVSNSMWMSLERMKAAVKNRELLGLEPYHLLKYLLERQQTSGWGKEKMSTYCWLINKWILLQMKLYLVVSSSKNLFYNTSIVNNLILTTNWLLHLRNNWWAQQNFMSKVSGHFRAEKMNQWWSLSFCSARTRFQRILLLYIS